MNTIVLIAFAEWRYWLRSRVALVGALIFFVLVSLATVVNTLRIHAEQHTRLHSQTQAEETFKSQPDRHPHRMVHYGHYVFRSPVPLAIFDSGLDPVTGQSIFLEGHRQNSATFSESNASAVLGGLANINPALIYQMFAPLLVILLGHSALVRERESSNLVSLLTLGVKPWQLSLAKGLALISFVLILMVPLLISCAIAVSRGDSVLSSVTLVSIYGVYLSLWVFLVLIAGVLFRKRTSVLASLTSAWLVLTLVMPSLAVSYATVSVPIMGKIENDLRMLTDLRKLGDGHNANDPAFQKLRADLLKEHGKDKVEDLPVNFRGLVALNAEKKLTEVLNEYAEERMALEYSQESVLMDSAWLSPYLAVSLLSRSMSATDLAHYHRFQREAETLRFEFVQGLNRAHADQLSYQDDINRNKDEASWQRARVDSVNWEVLDSYRFVAAGFEDRLNNGSPALYILIVWSVVSAIAYVLLGRRIRL
jgi:ABC-2 type transport system permease protein